jgi:hypothetical protein
VVDSLNAPVSSTGQEANDTSAIDTVYRHVVDPSTEAGLAVAKGSATFTQCRDTATGKSTVVNEVLADLVYEGLVEEYADARRARLFRLGGQG